MAIAPATHAGKHPAGAGAPASNMPSNIASPRMRAESTTTAPQVTTSAPQVTASGVEVTASAAEVHIN